MVDRGLGKHGKVLHLGLPEGGAVGRDEDHLRLSGAKSLQSGLVTEDGLAGLHDQLEPGVHGLDVLLLLGEMGETKCLMDKVRNELTVQGRPSGRSGRVACGGFRRTRGELDEQDEGGVGYGCLDQATQLPF